LAATGASLLAFFPGLIAEGVVKGFERFGVLRAVEVGATLAYAAGTLAVVAAGASYDAVAYAFLASIAGRYLVLGVVAAVEMRRAGVRPARWGDAVRRDIARRS